MTPSSTQSWWRSPFSIAESTTSAGEERDRRWRPPRSPPRAPPRRRPRGGTGGGSRVGGRRCRQLRLFDGPSGFPTYPARQTFRSGLRGHALRPARAAPSPPRRTASCRRRARSADGARALVPPGEREADVAVELVELPAQEAHAGLDVARRCARRRVAEQRRRRPSAHVSGRSCMTPTAPMSETTSC